jgi:glycosyltransferase involved in cell wall biosynthesis
MRIDQFVPALHRGDAIGDTALHLRDFLRGRGFGADLYCLNHDLDLAGEARAFADYPPPAPEDVAILHYALPSPLTDGLARLRCRRWLIHHNITPPEFFAPFSAEFARLTRIGREELERLASVVELGLADSEFNRRELASLGFRVTDVLPLFVDFSKYDKAPSAFIRDLYRDERTNILFVGRVAPNKMIEDLIRVAFYYKKYVSPLVRLIVVGKTGALPVYYESLVRMADEFYLKPEEIVFAGHVPDEELFAYYGASDVFLSLSEHEGFCLPLLESMRFDLPVVAYAAGAVPGTLDGAGVLLGRKRVDEIAELVDLVARDAALRGRILAGQRDRLARFRAQDVGGFFLKKISGGA